MEDPEFVTDNLNSLRILDLGRQYVSFVRHLQASTDVMLN